MSARFSRGSSVLAALILVVLVGGVALAINTIATPGHDLALSSSQLAQIGGTVENQERQEDAFSSSAPRDCADAKQKALGKVIGPDSVNINNGQSGTMDSCWGAYSSTGKPSSKLSDYQCTGRTGYADFGDGIVTVKTSVSNLAPGGKCVIAICQNGKCSGAKEFEGVNQSKYAAVPSDPRTALVQNDGSSGQRYTELDGAQSDAIKNAFTSTPGDAQKAFAATEIIQSDQQIENNNARITELRDFLNSCETTDACEGVDESFVEISDLEKQNAALTAQSDKLAGDIKNITPDPGAGITVSANTRKDYDAFGNACGADGSDAATCGGNQTGFKPAPSAGQQQQQQQQQQTERPQSSGGIGGFMQSILGSLAKALLGGAGAGGGIGGNCTSDQNQYQQQQQQYQQQMTLYNQQLQQYNYQAQLAQMQGYPPPPPPQPPAQPCFNQSSGGKPVQCTTSPQQPSPTGCQGGTWRPTTQSGNSCISGWQCVPGGTGTPPTAQLSCQPQVADVGMTIAISFSCGNATGSAGQGFDTDNKLSGSATTTISNPPAGATKATYGLRCTNGNVPATASCSVDISRPSIILVANPKVIAVNASSTIGWITTGMKSCVVSSEDAPEFTAQNALNTSINGMAVTPPLEHTSEFLLHCTTLGGLTKDATTTVQVGAPQSSDDGVTVQTSADGSSVARGGSVSVTWNASTTPDAAVSLWLFDEGLQQATALIARNKGFSGTYTWALPAATSSCPADSAFACASDLVPGRTYRIEAAVYTPEDAYLGGFPPADPVQPTYLADGLSGTFTISQ